MFAYFNPIQLSVDPITMLWLNAFALNLQRSVKMLSVEQTDPPYLDVKIEAIMFRVSIFFKIILFRLYARATIHNIPFQFLILKLVMKWLTEFDFSWY